MHTIAVALILHPIYSADQLPFITSVHLFSTSRCYYIMLLPLSYITNIIDYLTNLRASDVDSFWRQNINMLTFTRYQYITCRPLKSTLVPIFWPTRSALNMHGAFCSLRKAATSSIISLAGNWALSPPIENQNICQRKLKFAKCIEF